MSQCLKTKCASVWRGCRVLVWLLPACSLRRRPRVVKVCSRFLKAFPKPESLVMSNHDLSTAKYLNQSPETEEWSEPAPKPGNLNGLANMLVLPAILGVVLFMFWGEIAELTEKAGGLQASVKERMEARVNQSKMRRAEMLDLRSRLDQDIRVQHEEMMRQMKERNEQMIDRLMRHHR